MKIHSYLGYDATKITENFSVAFSWRLSQGVFFQCGGFIAFWRNIVLICLEIQHGIAMKFKNFFQTELFFLFQWKNFPFQVVSSPHSKSCLNLQHHENPT